MFYDKNKKRIIFNPNILENIITKEEIQIVKNIMSKLEKRTEFIIGDLWRTFEGDIGHFKYNLIKDNEVITAFRRYQDDIGYTDKTVVMDLSLLWFDHRVSIKQTKEFSKKVEGVQLYGKLAKKYKNHFIYNATGVLREGEYNLFLMKHKWVNAYIWKVQTGKNQYAYQGLLIDKDDYDNDYDAQMMYINKNFI